MNMLSKRLLLICLVCLSLNAFGQTIPNPELLYYKFNEVGTSVTNYATTPPAGTATATILGGITQGSNGQCDGALIGSGVASSTDYLNTGWATNLTGSAWTISFWSSNITPSATLFYIFGDVGAGSFRCFTNGVAGANNWILRGTFTDVLVTGGATVAPSMTTFVYDPIAGDIKAYLNGVLVNTVAQVGPTINGAGPFKVMGYSSNVGSPVGGLMDEFRVYNRALNTTEITQLYVRSTSETVSVNACGDYTSPSGNYTWNTPGTYLDTIPNSYCGDSLMTINLSINSPSFDTISAVACSSFDSPSGNYTWTTSGMYYDTIPNAVGCDSLLTIDLTINYPSADTFSIAACTDYTSPSGNYTWTTSGMYYDTIPNAIGCDSLLTIDLTINNPSADTFAIVECDQYISPSGNYTWTTSGTYYDTISNASGCDSLMTIDLTILLSSTSTIDTIVCGDYTAPDNTVYSTSGQYIATIPNAVGCDSVITINYTNNDIQVTISVSGITLTANAVNGSTYQWIDCANSNPIAGATNQTFTPTANGSYAVQVDNATCSTTSSCSSITTIGLQENESMADIHVFPNPVSTNLTISNTGLKNLTLEVYDNAGKLMLTTHSSEAVILLNMEQLVSGIYLVKAISTEGQQTYRIMRD